MPYIKRQFVSDFRWLLGQSNSVIVKYFPLLLYFYACYSLMQTLMSMNSSNWNIYPDKPITVTYMLSGERASEGQPAVKNGWGALSHLSDLFLNKLSSYSQCLDILNSMFEDEDNLMTFQEIFQRFDAMDFDDDTREACETVLDRYQTAKREALGGRDSQKGDLSDTIETTAGSYREFVDKLLKLCIDLQSSDYPRMKLAMYYLVNIRLLESRRGYKVLALDDEMLLFLSAMMVKNDDRIRLDELFDRFHQYGIDFSYQTRNAISNYLAKLNLLERKSDSGEAQYVRIVL